MMTSHEDLCSEEVLRLLTDLGEKDSLSKALSGLKKLLFERKKYPDELIEFLFCFNDRLHTFLDPPWKNADGFVVS